MVTGHYSDGVDRDLTSSATGTTYHSANPELVAVSPEGVLTVQAEGSTFVTARNQEASSFIVTNLIRDSYALGVSMSGAGTVTSTPAGIECGATCAATFKEGTSVSLTAMPASGSTFAGWSGDCAGTGTCAVAMNAAKSVTAAFNSPPAALTVAKTGTGSGTVISGPAGINCGTTCSTPFAYGVDVTLTATPASGSAFTGWSGGGCTGTGNCTVTIDAAQTITATFNSTAPPSIYFITVSKTGTGGGTVTSDSKVLNCGAICSIGYGNQGGSVTLTLTATPASGSTFAGWSGACSGTGACTVTLNTNQSATATFNTITPGTYALTVNKGGPGSGAVTGSSIDCGATCIVNFAGGTQVTLTAMPASGFIFEHWSGACLGASASCTVTTDAAKTVTAYFLDPNYSLTLSKAGTGSGTVTATSDSCDSNCSTKTFYGYYSGYSFTLSAAPASGSTFAGWSGACLGTGTCTVVTNAPKSVIATFTASGSTSYTLTVNTAGTGSGTGGGGGNYAAGAKVNLTATPASGSTFSGWSSSPCAASFTMPAKALTCTATFTATSITYPLTVTKTGTGSGTVSGSGNYAAGAIVKLTATPATGSTFTGWSPSSCAASFTMPVKALTCTATFALSNGNFPEMVTIPAGTFVMGSPASEPERDSDETQHTVTVASFAMGKYEVTFDEYDRFADATSRTKPSDQGWGRGQRPVMNVDWNDAVAYTNWVSQQTGQKYRLPTEAEWEYAARAGTTTAFWWGTTASHEYANYGTDSCCDGFVQGRDQWFYTAPVGSFPANRWGLYDTAGNVWEWTCSLYVTSYAGEEQVCSTTDTGGARALRGGSWYFDPFMLRSAFRSFTTPTNRSLTIGFRLARSF